MRAKRDNRWCILFAILQTLSLIHIYLTNQSEVETLLVNNNQLKKLDLSKLTKLATLYCYTNQLTKLDLSTQPQLQMLHAYGNKLTACEVNDLYASLCSYPKGVKLQTPYSLYITEDKSCLLYTSRCV